MSFPLNLKGDEVEYLCISDEDENFTTIIGCIEDLMMNDTFLQMQHAFLEDNWMEFEDTDENKLIYMDIFQEYQLKIEHYIEEYLLKHIIGFDMEDFIQELMDRKDDLDGEIFDLLFTFTDFLVFKDMFLDYKAMKEGNFLDLGSEISITKLSMK